MIELVVHRQNMTIDPEVFDKFCLIASKKGIKISTWVTARMREFIEEEELLQELISNRKK